MRVRVRDLDLPERMKRYTSSRVKEGAHAQNRCGQAIESKTQTIGECGPYLPPTACTSNTNLVIVGKIRKEENVGQREQSKEKRGKENKRERKDIEQEAQKKEVNRKTPTRKTERVGK